MADTSLNIGLQLAGLGNTVAGLNQTTQAINQVAAATQRARQSNQLGQDVAGGILGSLGVPTSVAAAVGGAMGFTRALFATASQAKDLSEQLNLSTTEVQMLQKAANDAGVSFGRLVGSLGILDQQRQAAIGGNERYRAAFSALGVSVGELNDESVRAIDLQRRLADATARGTDAQRAAAQVLLGAQGTRLLPALQALGGMSGDQVASVESINEADAVGKAWENIWARVKVVGIEVIADLSQKARGIFEEGLVDRFGSNATRESRVRRAAAIDQAAIDAGVITPAQGGPEFQQLQRFNTAADEARRRGQRLTFTDFAGLEDTQQRRAADQERALQRDRQAVDSVLTANAEKRRKLELDALPVVERRARLEAQRQAELQVAQGDPDAVRAAQAEGRALDIEAQLAGLKMAEPAALSVNQWERLGASFAGGPGLAQEAVQVARETQRTVERMAVGVEAFVALSAMGIPVHFREQ